MIMIRIRPKRRRNIAFEALEGRLALSTGMSLPSHQIHHAVVRSLQHKIPASFKGRVSISGSELTTTNLKGRIGPDRFTGYGTGTIVGNRFQGGDVFLSNSNGTIHLGLSPLFAVRVGKAKSQKYAPFVGSTGTVTRWNVPARQNAQASVSGVFNL
jgi:hypothetical protein